MELESARSLLGLGASTSADEVETAYAARLATVEERLKSAPTDALRAKYQQSLAEIENARNALLATLHTTAPNLSATQMADLPGAAPVYTQAGFNQPSSAAANQLKIGQVLANRYEIRARIGVGGMGAVYRALDRNRAEEIAIKVLLPHLLANQTARDRFLAEAKIASKLSHPNIVNVFDVQRDGGNDFLTMELLLGQTLRERIAARNSARQPYGVVESLAIGKAIGDALAYAHKYTVHRDVKPENIWIDDEGGIKLMDFGIARLMSTSQMTQTSTAMGTAYYMAPEQLKGAKNIDGRADQYSLAVMLYELMSGDIPAGKIRSLNNLNKRVSKPTAMAIDRALDSQPEGRYPDMRAFVQALGARGGVSGKTWGSMGGVLAAVLMAVAMVMYWPQIQHLFPDAGAAKNDKSEAIESQGAIQALLQRLDAQSRTLDGRVRDAKSAVDRLDGMVRMARNDEERNDLTRQFNDAKAAAQMAGEVQDLAQRNVYHSNALIQIKAQQTLGDATLRDGNVQDAAKVLGDARKSLEKMVTTVDSIEKDLQMRNDYAARMHQYGEIFKQEGDNLDPVLAASQQHAKDAEAKLANGDFDGARGDYEQAMTTGKAAMENYLDTLATNYGKLASAKLAANDLSTADAALKHAKALSQVKAALK